MLKCYHLVWKYNRWYPDMPQAWSVSESYGSIYDLEKVNPHAIIGEPHVCEKPLHIHFFGDYDGNVYGVEFRCEEGHTCIVNEHPWKRDHNGDIDFDDFKNWVMEKVEFEDDIQMPVLSEVIGDV